jgi:hypothetical protein
MSCSRIADGAHDDQLDEVDSPRPPEYARRGVPKTAGNAFRRSWQTWAHTERISQRAIADVVGHANLETQHLHSVRKRPVETVLIDE